MLFINQIPLYKLNIQYLSWQFNSFLLQLTYKYFLRHNINHRIFDNSKKYRNKYNFPLSFTLLLANMNYHLDINFLCNRYMKVLIRTQDIPKSHLDFNNTNPHTNNNHLYNLYIYQNFDEFYYKTKEYLISACILYHPNLNKKTKCITNIHNQYLLKN